MNAVFSTSQPQDISSAPVPEGFYPEGVAQTCFDTDLLYLIEHAIPSSINGLKIFAHLLYYATLDPKTAMQHSLFHVTGEYGDEAIILINSIEALARTDTSPCAPETYHKVLLAFEAMQVIRRKFHQTYTEIRIPLGKRIIHIPSLLAGLQKMYKKHGNVKGTNKFQKFALRVAACIKSGEFVRYESSSKIALSHKGVAQVLLGLLQEHNVKEVRVPSLNEACELIVQAVQSGRVGANSGESVALVIRGKVSNSGESVTQPGEFVEGDTGDQISALEQVGESLGTNSPTLTSFCTEKSKKRGRTRSIRLKKGEAEAIFAANSPEFADLESFSTNLGESVAAVSFIGHIPSGNIPCKREVTLNDDTPDDSPAYKDPRPIEAIRHEAADFAERLDGSRDSRWFARFVKTVQIYPPHVRRLAEIDVMYHSAFPDYRGKPDRPGAVFFKRCEEYANPQFKVVDQIHQWDVSGMDIKAIRQELQRGRPVPSAAMLPFLDEQSVPVQTEGSGDEQERSGNLDSQSSLPTWLEENRETAQHSLLNTRMNQNQANALCKQIRQEGQAFCNQVRQEGQAFDIQTEVYPGDRDGEFVVVTVWQENGEESEEEWVNAAKWNRYFEQVKKCYLK